MSVNAIQNLLFKNPMLKDNAELQEKQSLFSPEVFNEIEENIGFLPHQAKMHLLEFFNSLGICIDYRIGEDEKKEEWDKLFSAQVWEEIVGLQFWETRKSMAALSLLLQFLAAVEFPEEKAESLLKIAEDYIVIGNLGKIKDGIYVQVSATGETSHESREAFRV